MEIIVSNSKELISSVNMSNGTDEKVNILLKSGIYEINETLHLNSNIEMCGEDNVVLKGTKRIPIDISTYVDGRYVIDLNKIGITDTGKIGLGVYRDFWKDYDIPKPHMTDCGPSMELYFDDIKMNISKYPEKGFVYIDKALGKTFTENEYEKKTGTEEGVFIPSDTDIFDNNDFDNMLLIGFWNYNWASQRHKIKSYDRENKVVSIEEPYHVFGYMDKCETSPDDRGKFYILNVLSEVKKHGDWYIDRKENKLYFIPFEGQEYIDIALCENLFEAENAENITIKNISVFGCRKSAFSFTNCKNINIENCQMNNLGAWGAILDWCDESTVSGCNIYNTGGGGIACSGGDRNILELSRNVVKGNIIHNIAYWHKTYLAGIEVSGVGVTVSENKIYDVPHFAIVFQGNEHIIEKNHIQNACYESNDAGAIYAGRDWTCRGNIIRYNCIQDLPGCNSNGCVGIYFDDAMSSAQVYGNILSNMSFVGIMVGGGRDFDIHDNYFYNCHTALSFDSRLMIDNGYLYDKLYKHLNEVPYKSEIWKKSYPDLYTILEDEPKKPKNSKFYNNTVIGGHGIAFLGDDNEDENLKRSNNTYIKIENTPLHHHYAADTHFIAEDM